LHAKSQGGMHHHSVGCVLKCSVSNASSNLLPPCAVPALGSHPTLKDVPGRSPMFVFPGELGESAALVRCRSLLFTPTVAKTVAIWPTSADSQLGFYGVEIVPTYREALRESIDGTGQRHGVPIRLKHLAADAVKELAEALWDIVVMITGEAAKRAIWG